MSVLIWLVYFATLGSNPKTCCTFVYQQCLGSPVQCLTSCENETKKCILFSLLLLYQQCLIRLHGTGSQRVYGSRHRPRAGQPVLERKLWGLQGVALRGGPCQLCPQRLEAKGPSDSCGKATGLLRGGACKSAGLHEVCMKDLLGACRKST